MKLLIRSVWTDVKRDPVRGLLTILGIAVGVAIVTLTVNVGNALVAASRAGFATPGLRMVVALAELQGKGELLYGRDSLSYSDMEAIRELVPSVKAIAPVEGLWVTPDYGVDFGTVQVGDARFRTRSVAAVGAEYGKVYDLRMIAGSFFSAEDLEAGKRVIVVSGETAQALFGSAEAALGKAIGAFQMPGSKRIDYQVVGVFQDVPSSLREGYQIGDFLVPLLLPPKVLTAFAATVDEADPNVAAAKLEAAVRSLHGQDTKVLAWRGNRWNYGDPMRGQSGEIQSVVLFLDGFGILALIVASTGILTMMMVGVVERARSIGLRRALGSRRAGVVGWFVGEALLLTGAGALLGIAAAAVFSGAAMRALAPMLPGADGAWTDLPSILRLDSVVVGALSALLAGAVFSLPPALMAARVQPAESMGET